MGDEDDGSMGARNKAYVEGRLKLLESGQQVIKGGVGGGGQTKWKSKAEAKGYNMGNDFQASKRQRLDDE